MESLISSCKSRTYITIDSLYDYCKIPSDCGQKIRCEGKVALIKGYIDYGNVFDKRNYPNLPYQKFLITNRERNKSLEVWVASEGSEGVFKKIYDQQAANPECAVHVEGILVGFDMPIMGTCRRELRLNLTGASSLGFDAGCLSEKQ